MDCCMTRHLPHLIRMRVWFHFTHKCGSTSTQAHLVNVSLPPRTPSGDTSTRCTLEPEAVALCLSRISMLCKVPEQALDHLYKVHISHVNSRSSLYVLSVWGVSELRHFQNSSRRLVWSGVIQIHKSTRTKSPLCLGIAFPGRLSSNASCSAGLTLQVASN